MQGGMRLLPLLAATWLALTPGAGCSDDDGKPNPDQGPAIDTGFDTALPDSGPQPDLPDLGPQPDSGPSPDVGPVTPDAGVPAAQVTLTKIGSPSWKPTDVVVFAAPVGSQGDEMCNVAETILPAHKCCVGSPTCYGVCPDTAHSPPFDLELSSGVKAAGYLPTGLLTVQELKSPSGFYVAFTLVPDVGAPTGSSPDFASGPVLDPADFPLTEEGGVHINGAEVDSYKTTHCALADLVPGATQTSYSHLHGSLADNSEWITVVPGTYEAKIQFRNSAGTSGWDLTVSFVVQ